MTFRPKVCLNGIALWSREGVDLGDEDESHVLPARLFDRLTGGTRRYEWVYYETPELAQDALIRAMDEN
jgi:hypothetical protein